MDGRAPVVSAKANSNSGGKTPSGSHSHQKRKFVVFSSLVGVLTLTSALLLALAPAPLTADAASSLFAVDQPATLDVIFDTNVPANPGRWKYIYIHHSRTPAGNATTLAADARGPLGMGDHFVIGNGDGAIDGEIQVGQRWMQQAPAAAPVKGSKIDPACISICLVGDFDRTVPTSTQMRRLAQLVGTLQGRHQIPAANVQLMDQAASAAGVGRYFPSTAFRTQLLPQ
jgi:hypothetical protein